MLLNCYILLWILAHNREHLTSLMWIFTQLQIHWCHKMLKYFYNNCIDLINRYLPKPLTLWLASAQYSFWLWVTSYLLLKWMVFLCFVIKFHIPLSFTLILMLVLQLLPPHVFGLYQSLIFHIILHLIIGLSIYILCVLTDAVLLKLLFLYYLTQFF